MTDIILTTKGMTPSVALKELGEHNDFTLQDTQCIEPNRLRPYTPYSLSPANGSIDPDDRRFRPVIMTTLSSKGLAKSIADPLMEFNSEDLAALAEMMDGLEAATVSGTGAIVSITADRVSAFVAAVYRYQQALLRYHKLAQSKGGALGGVAQARGDVHYHYRDLHAKFQAELQAIKNRRMLSGKRSPLYNLKRGASIAKDNRTGRAVGKLSVTNHVEGTRLVKFGQHANVLGTGLVAVDFGTRIGNVHTEYLSGGDWSRELFRESLSFAFSTGVAFYGSQYAAAAILPLLSPFGWVFLIIGGLALAGGIAASAMVIDKYFKHRADSWYDSAQGLF